MSDTIYPTFYGAVHRAWVATTWSYGCMGDTDRYEPDDHRCFELAGALRVELHAAGISLSNEGNGAIDPWDEKVTRVIASAQRTIDHQHGLPSAVARRAYDNEQRLRDAIAYAERSFLDDEEDDDDDDDDEDRRASANAAVRAWERFRAFVGRGVA